MQGCVVSSLVTAGCAKAEFWLQKYCIGRRSTHPPTYPGIVRQTLYLVPVQSVLLLTFLTFLSVQTRSDFSSVFAGDLGVPRA